MASAKDDIFLKVEAVLSLDWVKSSGKDLTTMLEEIENLGIDSINFSRGNHVLGGSLEQLVRIRENFLGKKERRSPPGKTAAAERRSSPGNVATAYPAWQDDYTERQTEQRGNDVSWKGLFSSDREREESDAADAYWGAYPKLDRPSPGKEPEAPKDRPIERELMVDNDIWEYIENKKAGELKDLETMFAATLTKAEDDSGVLKIAITPKSEDTTADEVGIMHETLVGLYQETFMKCVIEKHEVHFSDEEAELVLEYIAEKFPDVFAKRCIYNDDFLFIGPPRLAREARQQFQVLSQRLKKGQLRAKMDNRGILDGYARRRGRLGSYEDRYNQHENDLYKESAYEFTNDIQNVSNEDVAKEENRPEFLTEDEGRIVYPEGRQAEEPNDKHSSEEDEPKAEEREPEPDSSKDMGLPDDDWYRRDNTKRSEAVVDLTLQSGSSSLVYRRQEIEEGGRNDRRSGSDVEDDDWKQEFSAKNSEIKKDGKSDELPNGFERPREAQGVNDVEEEAGEATGSRPSLYNRIRSEEDEFEGTRAARSLDDVSDRNRQQPEDDGRVAKRDPPTARIDANSITYRSLDPAFNQAREELTLKGAEELVNSSSDEKTVTAKKPRKKSPAARKKTFEYGPKVRIIKQTIPVFAAESKVVSEPEVIGATSSSGLAAGETMICRGAAKSSHREVLGAPCRIPSELEKLELEEVFRAQRKTLEKMPFDSESSEDDDDAERGAAAHRRGRKKGKDEKLTHQMIEELMARGDEASQKLLQSLLEKETEDTTGRGVPFDNDKVENNVVEEAMPGGGKLQKDRPTAVEKPAVSGRRTKANNDTAVPQPPDGSIVCVMDKAFHLEGHDKSGTIEININFEDGEQADDQLEPGRPYRGMTMKAYLPATGDGRETLRLMKAAFAARKLFTLQDDGDEDVIVPNGVTFKDKAELYPDPGYLPKVIEQLRLLTEQQDK